MAFKIGDVVMRIVWFKFLWVILSFALAIYAPLTIGEMLYEKLKDN